MSVLKRISTHTNNEGWMAFGVWGTVGRADVRNVAYVTLT